ncbi:MAG TPA: anti-sigma regulatory factor [Allocoleopsis sp.]
MSRCIMYQQKSLRVESKITLLLKVLQWFEDFCSQYVSDLNWSNIQFYQLHLALTEGFTNAVRHAHKQLPSDTIIDIDLILSDDRLDIQIWDYGQPFNPDNLPEPMPGIPQLGGYGWFLLKKLADQVVYQRSLDERNCLLIRKYLKSVISNQ